MRFGVLGLVLIAAVGCGKDPNQLPVSEVTGSVTYNGQPMRGASVSLIPAVPNPKLKIPPFGEVKEDGTFAVTTYGGGDGAPPGEYKVTLTWSDNDPDSPSDLCKGRYASAKKPIATITVVEGENVVPPIELKGPAIVVPAL